jgi:hypothetical protein
MHVCTDPVQEKNGESPILKLAEEEDAEEQE